MCAYLQDSVPNVYSLEHRTNSNAQVTLSKGETGISPNGKDLTYDYEMDGSVDKNYSKPGETIGDEYDYANEKEFWEPASQEKELKMQVEKLTEIPVINNKDLQ